MRAILIPIHARSGSVAAALLVALVSVACASPDGSTDGRSRISVVAAFYPIQEAVERVGGDLVEVTNLTAPGVEPHDLELTPDQVEAIATADVVLYLGEGFQPAVQDALAEAEGVVVDLLAGLPTVEPPDGSEGGLEVDPHVWLSPALYIGMIERVQGALSDVAPDDASTLQENAGAFAGEISALDDEYEEGLARCDRSLMVTSHAAFGYLAGEYGLTQAAISGLAPDAEPSAQRLSELRELVEREGVTTVFTEDLVSPKVAETLAEEAGVRTAVLHTIEGLTDTEIAAGDDYGSQMRDNLSTLEAALGCS